MSESTQTPKKKPTRAATAAGAADKPAGAAAAKNAQKAPALENVPPVKVAEPVAEPKSAGKSTKVRAPAADKAAGTKPKTTRLPAKAKSEGKVAASGLPEQEVIDRMVAEAAYYLAEKRSFAAGFEEQDWLAAKEQIMSQLLGAKKPKKG